VNSLKSLAVKNYATDLPRLVALLYADGLLPVSRKGKEHFNKKNAYVITSNHNSFVDVPVVSPWIPEPNKTLAKVEMAKIPFSA
jgi:1-acyl-sn-glycerol-3-phosphate acyltransferase